MAQKTRSQLKLMVDGADAPHSLHNHIIDSSPNVLDDLDLTAGVVGAATVVAKEYTGRTVLTLTNFVIGALAGAAAALAVGNKLYTFPAGVHLEGPIYIDLVLKAAGTAVAADVGLGAVIGSGAVATLDGTATFENRCVGSTINTAAAGGAAVQAFKQTTGGIQTGLAMNVAAFVKDVFLNAAGTWNANNTGNLTATGTIILYWDRGV